MVDEGLRWRREDDEQRKEKRVTGTHEQELVAEGLRACVEGRRGPGQQVVNAVTGSGRERGRGGKMSRRWRERAHGRAEAGKQRAARLVATQGEDASMYYCNQRGRARWRPNAYYAHLAQDGVGGRIGGRTRHSVSVGGSPVGQATASGGREALG